MGGNGGSASIGGNGDPNANGWVCSAVLAAAGGVPSWSIGIPGCVMFEMSESLSLWIMKHSVVAAAGGVTVPERGDVGASEGSGLVSLRCSGGDSGWCGPACSGTGDGDGGCRSRAGT
jgi:hypothetical protein